MIYCENDKIKINEQQLKSHAKATEKYVDVSFALPHGDWHGWIPVEYRRTGVNLQTDEEISDYIEKIYNIMEKTPPSEWLSAEEQFWREEKPNAATTKEFFDILAQGGWKCNKHELPQNPNFARRIQDLKEFGYTLATDTARFCPICEKNTTNIILLPIPRAFTGGGYETWSKQLRKRILEVLQNYDVYESKKTAHLLPDHKFPEIRWDENTKEENSDSMTDEEISQKFQLLTNQRNQQKREVCRTCFQTGKRQYPFGIKYFYHGGEDWDSAIPTRGKSAEDGCFGCGWYDMEKWRQELLELLC
ncbi:MAG: restriction endonuclease [Defluviitaleaceae bacterium]|nr:restriction endonuclease [Defluviitaleaceae bacterium]